MSVKNLSESYRDRINGQSINFDPRSKIDRRATVQIIKEHSSDDESDIDDNNKNLASQANNIAKNHQKIYHRRSVRDISVN